MSLSKILCPFQLRIGTKLFLTIFAVFANFYAHAMVITPLSAGDKISMNINITGTVIATGQCIFNRGSNVTIGFDTVRYHLVKGINTLEGNYKKTIPSDMSCSGDTEGNPSMSLSSTDGSSLDWHGNKILNVVDDSSGKNNGLGIRLLVNDQPQDINSPFVVDIKTPPKIEVELVQTDDGSKFISGNTFSSNATLTMTFD